MASERHQPDRGETRRYLLDTAFRGVLGVALFASFPAFSDIYRLWRRDAGIVQVQLEPGQFEYPPIAALLWRPLSWLPNERVVVVVNGLLMVGAAVAITWLLLRSEDERNPAGTELWSRSTALIFLLAINWDAAAALIVVWGVGMLKRDKIGASGAALGIGTALKIFPGAVVPSLLFLLVGGRQRFRFGITALAAVGLAYGIYALAQPEGWRLHLDFAAQRDDYQTTVWGPVLYALEALGVEPNLSQLNLAATTMGGLALLSIAAWSFRHRPTFGEAAALGMTAFLLFNKTFKPQYALWVLPLFALVSVRPQTYRALELAALFEFFAIYFSFPWAVTGIGALARILALVAGAVEILRRVDRGRTDIARIG